MSTTKCISDNAIKNNASTLFATTGENSDTINGIAISNSLYNSPGGLKVNSGLGLAKGLSGGTFAKMEMGEYVATIIGDRVAGTNDTFLTNGASQAPSQKPGNMGNIYHADGYTGWDYVTHAPTFNNDLKGSGVQLYDPLNDTYIDEEPRPTMAIPGEFTYTYGSLTPAVATFNSKTLG